MQHARATAQYNVYYGRGRDRFDVRGRVAHESLFNVANGTYRGPSTQQGYSPFTTWTRGLAWAMLGFAEQLEFLEIVPDEALQAAGGRAAVEAMMLDAARATCDHYIDDRRRPTAFRTGMPARPAWRRSATGAIARPIRSTIASRSTARRPRSRAQGLLRLGRLLRARGDPDCRHATAGRPPRRRHARSTPPDLT